MWIGGKNFVGACVCTLISVICVVLSVLLLVYFSAFVEYEITSKSTIVPGHSSYEQLQNPTLPVYKDVYFYNLTNPQDLVTGGRPRLQQVGPYSFREYRLKYYNESDFRGMETELQYTQRKLFYFSANTSDPDVHEDDTICTVNVAMVGAMSLAQGLSGLTRTLAIALLGTIFVSTKAELYMCLPAVNLVFNYTDDLVLELHKNFLLRLYGLNLPVDHVSLQLNDSINDTRPSIIHTGVDDVTLVGQFQQWNSLTKLDLWPGDSANDINGTEGLLFRPLLEEGDNLTVFVDDVARSFPLVYRDTTNILGLKVFRYELPTEVFQSAATNPDNVRWGSWCPDGLIYLGVLQYPPVPVFGSKPHFLDADPELTRDKFDMPGPNKSEDDTVMNVQPEIGVTIQFTRQLQLNMQLNQSSDFPQLRDLNGTMYYPILYVNEHAELTPEFKAYLESQGLNMLGTATWAHYVLFAILVLVAILALAGAVCCFVFGIRKRRKYQGYEPVDN